MTATAHAFVINWSRPFLPICQHSEDKHPSAFFAYTSFQYLHCSIIFRYWLQQAPWMPLVDCLLLLSPETPNEMDLLSVLSVLSGPVVFSVVFKKIKKGRTWENGLPGFWCLFETTAIWLFDGLAGVWPSRFERIALQNLWILKQVYMALSFSTYPYNSIHIFYSVLGCAVPFTWPS